MDDRSSYVNRYFNVTILDSDEFTSNNRSLLGRLRNNLVNALNKCTAIPKFIVIVLEDAIINDAGTANYGIVHDYEIRLKWLLNQLRRAIESFLDYLQQKCKREGGWPKLLFICPSLHRNYRNNSLRKKFIRVLEDQCSITYRCTAMRLRTGWDYDDSSIFLEPQQRFSTEGIATFWHAADKIIEEYNLMLFDSVDNPNEPTVKRYDTNHRNEFLWQSPTYMQNRRQRGRNWRAGNRY